MNKQQEYNNLYASLKSFDANIINCYEPLYKSQEKTKSIVSLLESTQSIDSQIYSEINELFEKIKNDIYGLSILMVETHSNVDKEMKRRLTNIQYEIQKEKELQNSQE